MKHLFLLLATMNISYADLSQTPDFVCQESKLSENKFFKELKVTHLSTDPGGAGYNATFLVELTPKENPEQNLNYYFELDHMDYFAEVKHRRLSHKIWADVLDYRNDLGVLKLTKDNQAILELKSDSKKPEHFHCHFYNGY